MPVEDRGIWSWKRGGKSGEAESVEEHLGAGGVIGSVGFDHRAVRCAQRWVN